MYRDNEVRKRGYDVGGEEIMVRVSGGRKDGKDGKENDESKA